jgi:TIR domain
VNYDPHKVIRERLRLASELRDSVEFVDDITYKNVQEKLIVGYIEEIIPYPEVAVSNDYILADQLPKLEVFFSYSAADEDLCKKLLSHLSPLKRQGTIHQWRNCQIQAGQDRGEEIDRHLDSAHVILLLVSADFIESDHCISTELKRAMERHEIGKARVIPIILRAVDLCGMPFEKLQPLPKNGHAVTSWSNQDEAFVDIAKGIRAAIEEMTALLGI